MDTSDLQLGDRVSLACGHTGRYIRSDYGICASVFHDELPLVMPLVGRDWLRSQAALHLNDGRLPSDKEVLAVWYGTESLISKRDLAFARATAHDPGVPHQPPRKFRRKRERVADRLPPRVVACIEAGRSYAIAHALRMEKIMRGLGSDWSSGLDTRKLV